MSTLRNKVSLIGHIGQKPEVQTLAGGYTVAKFSVATNERFKDKNGAWQEKTEWHNIKAWGKTAETVGKILDKGSEVALEGKLVHQQYESKTGEKRYSTEIQLNEFVLVGNKKEEVKK